jgi:hypothetical protein
VPLAQQPPLAQPLLPMTLTIRTTPLLPAGAGADDRQDPTAER